ncbi:hypothetical protein [Coleofasciculus sp.]|uniref:hypothetical protein n=1 Tax=Coleofasciculus sp. TaxID=3100458 RepID=UPI0039F7855F
MDATEDEKYTTQRIATYGFDPGLQVSDQVWINDEKRTYGTSQDENIHFLAAVTKRQKEVIPGRKSRSEQDLFRLVITLEAADKDHIARIAEIMRRLNPGEFQD